MFNLKFATIPRSTALDMARQLHKKLQVVNRNPFIDEDEIHQIVGKYQSLIDEHNLTEDEVNNSSNLPAIPTRSKQEILSFSENRPQSRVAAWFSQPSVVHEHEINDANRLGKKYDDSLPFNLGFESSSRMVDGQAYKNIVNSRLSQGLPEDIAQSKNALPGETLEAHALGMNPEKYAVARDMGVPHDYIRYTFVNSLRPHSVQTGKYRKNMMGQEESEFDKDIKEYKRQNPGNELATTDHNLEKSQGFIPIRMSVISPTDIAHAHSRGIQATDLLNAWHNDSFHPLGNHGYDFPISKYIALRGSGLSHDETRDVLSSLHHVPADVYQHFIKSGKDHKEIMSHFSDMDDMQDKDQKEIEPDKTDEIGTTGKFNRKNAARGDTYEQLFQKIKLNTAKYRDARTAPHTWLNRYQKALDSNSSHSELYRVCNTNANEAHSMAQTNSQYWANKKMWLQLGDMHSNEAYEELNK